jgi:phosphoribosylformylglycinamidine synthase
MVAKIPLEKGETATGTMMSYGFDPFLSEWSPFHGAFCAVTESLARIAACGGDPSACRLTLQEYFLQGGAESRALGSEARFPHCFGAYSAQLAYGDARPSAARTR